MSSKYTPYDEKIKLKKHDSSRNGRKTSSIHRSRSNSSLSLREKKRSKRTSRSRSRSRKRDMKKSDPNMEKSCKTIKPILNVVKKSRWSNVPPVDLNEKKKNLNLENFNFHSGNSLDILYKGSTNIFNNNELNNQASSLEIPVHQNFSSIYNTLIDSTKFKRKVYIPKQNGVNFVGLLIGPKGAYQKRLETQTNCKILIRGKGTQKEGVCPQLDDEEEQHVLIVGDSEENVTKAELLIQRVLYSDDETRNKIKEEQLKVAQEIRTDQYLGVDSLAHIEDHLMTPYGPPDKNARIIPVPNDCVGLIIGKNGETIRRLNREAACKIQIAKAPIPNTEVRNVFIEGPYDKYENAKRLIEDIVAEQQKMKVNFSSLGEQNPFSGPFTQIKIMNKFIGLIIGKNGETVRNLHQKTGCYIFIPKESKDEEDFRMLELSGNLECIKECTKEIEVLVENAKKLNEALYQSIDLDYLNIQNTQTIPQNEYLAKNKLIYPTQKYSNPIQFYPMNNIYHPNNQPGLQNFPNPYNYNYPLNNFNAIPQNFSRFNMNAGNINNGMYAKGIPMHPYGMNAINLNSLNVPMRPIMPSAPMFQHMSINNYPSTTYVNFSNNLTQNHINIQPTSASILNQKEKTENKSNESGNLEQKKATTNSLLENKKKIESTKKNSSSILNYIYGGQVK